MLAGFVLIGGSALALRLRHRRSEDLDLVFPESRLPRARLDALLRIATPGGFNFRRNDDEAALQEFALGGLELHDHQQNFVVNGMVRVSFFVPDVPLAKVLGTPPESKARVAALSELFKAKCLVAAVRSKTRDWLDLYLLMRDQGFSPDHFQMSFREAGVEDQCHTALARLCSGLPQKDDEGYAHLLPSPPSIEEMKLFFIAVRDRLETDAAEEAARKRKRP